MRTSGTGTSDPHRCRDWAAETSVDRGSFIPQVGQIGGWCNVCSVYVCRLCIDYLSLGLSNGVVCSKHRSSSCATGAEASATRWAHLRGLGTTALWERMYQALGRGGGPRPAHISGLANTEFCISRKDGRLWREGVRTPGLQWWTSRVGEKWGTAFCKLAGLAGEQASVEWLRAVADAVRCHDEADFISRIKDVSRLAIEFSVGCGFGAYSILMDLQVVGGFDTVLNRKDVMANIAAEVGHALPQPCAQRGEALMSRARSIVRENVRGKVGGVVSFEQFVNFRDAWATPGASTVDGAVVLQSVDGTSVKVKGKLAASLQFSDSELVSRANLGSPAVVKPFRKEDEAVKTRVVYGYDFWSFLRCSYADYLVDTWESGGNWLPLGYGRADKAEMRMSILRRLGGDEVAVSLDQSAFDTRQRKEWVRAVIDEIFTVLAEQMPANESAQLIKLRDAELRSFDEAFIPGVCAWGTGVPSGHRWTAVIDSVLNRAAAECVASELGFRTTLALYQGDDALLIGRGCSTSEGWAAVYRLYGLEVNADKTWISNRSCDFLHEVYRGAEARGFPSRVGRSLIWKKPSMGSEIGGIQSQSARLVERLGDALKGVRRGLVGARALALSMLTRFGAKHGVHQPHLIECFDTPSYLGGFGFGTWGRRRLEVSGGVVDTQRYSISSGLHPTLRRQFRGPLSSCLVARLGLAAFLRVTKLEVSCPRVLVPGSTPPTGTVPQSTPMRTAWAVGDGVGWWVALRLEAWKSRAVRWGEVAWLPDARLRAIGASQGLRVLVRYENLRKRLRLDITSTHSTAESWIYILDLLHRTWLGACSFFAWKRPDFERSGGIRNVEEGLAAAIHSYIYTHVPTLWVRV